jgi:hypothetical protein
MPVVAFPPRPSGRAQRRHSHSGPERAPRSAMRKAPPQSSSSPPPPLPPHPLRPPCKAPTPLFFPTPTAPPAALLPPNTPPPEPGAPDQGHFLVFSAAPLLACTRPLEIRGRQPCDGCGAASGPRGLLTRSTTAPRRSSRRTCAPARGPRANARARLARPSPSATGPAARPRAGLAAAGPDPHQNPTCAPRRARRGGGRLARPTAPRAARRTPPTLLCCRRRRLRARARPARPLLPGPAPNACAPAACPPPRRHLHFRPAPGLHPVAALDPCAPPWPPACPTPTIPSQKRGPPLHPQRRVPAVTLLHRPSLWAAPGSWWAGSTQQAGGRCGRRRGRRGALARRRGIARAFWTVYRAARALFPLPLHPFPSPPPFPIRGRPRPPRRAADMQAAMLRGGAFSSRVGVAPVRRCAAVGLAAPRPQTLVAPSFVGGERAGDAHWVSPGLRAPAGAGTAAGAGGRRAGARSHRGPTPPWRRAAGLKVVGTFQSLQRCRSAARRPGRAAP